MNVDILSEAYTILKQYIPVKDRQEAADTLMSVMIDCLSDDELKMLSSTDTALSRSYKEYVGESEEDFEDYED